MYYDEFQYNKNREYVFDNNMFSLHKIDKKAYELLYNNNVILRKRSLDCIIPNPQNEEFGTLLALALLVPELPREKNKLSTCR